LFVCCGLDGDPDQLSVRQERKSLSALAVNFTVYLPIVGWGLLPPVPGLRQYPPQLLSALSVIRNWRHTYPRR